MGLCRQMGIVTETHALQLGSIAALGALNVAVFFRLNRAKHAEMADNSLWTWAMRRNAYWTVMALFLSIGVCLDVYFPISPWLIPLKAYTFAFPVGLLDFYFSDTRGLSPQVLLGASLWCSTAYLRLLFVWFLCGHPLFPRIVGPDVTLLSVLMVFVRELLRFMCLLIFSGLFSDLLFSPMHRLLHHGRVYGLMHKTHHEFTNTLTSLVLYHGELLDDFLMPFTVTIGGGLYTVFASMIGCSAYSNVCEYLIIMATLLSHAHDTRCARLLAPLPDELNFVAYHYVHHLTPSNNFGLTEPSDLFWDWLLGVNTIRKMTDLEESQKVILERKMA